MRQAVSVPSPIEDFAYRRNHGLGIIFLDVVAGITELLVTDVGKQSQPLRSQLSRQALESAFFSQLEPATEQQDRWRCNGMAQLELVQTQALVIELLAHDATEGRDAQALDQRGLHRRI